MSRVAAREVAVDVHSWLRAIAGLFVVLSVIGAVTVSLWFLAFTAFVGLNLFQSAFTGWCPMMTSLRKLGVPEVCKR